MEKLIKNFWPALLGMLWAQNVGIGTTAPSERLHVNGNLRFDGALMPNGNAGTTGQVLTSQGPGTPPIWTTLGAAGAPQVYAGYTSASVTIPTSGTWTEIIAPISVPLNSGQRVLIFASGNARCASFTSCYALANLRIEVNGSALPAGGATRLTSHYTTSGGTPTLLAWQQSWSISATYVPSSAGTYDFRLVGQVDGGFSSAGMSVGGPGGFGPPQASLIVVVLP